MSFKSKDLHYDSSQPVFLRRLRGELTGTGDPHRHSQPIARPKRAKEDDVDDAPTYVLEDGNQTLSREEYEAFIAGKDSTRDSSAPGGDATETKPSTTVDTSTETVDNKTPKQLSSEVATAPKKKRPLKIGGTEEEDEEQGEGASKTNMAKSTKKPKKKAKKIKLSFEDE